MILDYYSQRRLMIIKGKLPVTGLNLNIGSSENLGVIPKGGRIINLDVKVFKMPNFVQANAERLPFKDRVFDNVFMFDVLEHLANDVSAITEAWRVLKNSGKVYAAIPCREDDFFRLELPLFMKKVDWSEKEKEWGHVRRGYTRQEVKQLFKKHFDLVHMERGIANFSRIGLQLYFLREWEKDWYKSRLMRVFLGVFNYLDYYLCNNKGHLIFAIFKKRFSIA
jgi:SAM-dependent methyltransferase